MTGMEWIGFDLLFFFDLAESVHVSMVSIFGERIVLS